MYIYQWFRRNIWHRDNGPPVTCKRNIFPLFLIRVPNNLGNSLPNLWET